MKRRSFFRSLAAALISVPLARMIGAEEISGGIEFVRGENPERFECRLRRDDAGPCDFWDIIPREVNGEENPEWTNAEWYYPGIGKVPRRIEA